MRLSAQQLEAIATMQAGLARIEKLRVSINTTAKANGLDVKGLALYELGAMVYGLEGLLFEHDSDEARRKVYAAQYMAKVAA